VQRICLQRRETTRSSIAPGRTRLHDRDMTILRAANLALKFVLELAAIAAFAYWGSTAGGGLLSVLLTILAPVVAVVLWGVFAAPRSERRLALGARVPFELGVFGLAVVALVAADAPVAAVVLAGVVVVNAALLTAFRQWEA
jgi:Protein of unknown function (DUF2568)